MERIFIKILKFILIFLFFLNLNVFSNNEGTKELRPTSSDFGNVQVYDKGRPFAMESNTDSLNRLYIRIASTSETVYLGFQHIGTGSATFRIKDPNGNVVYARTNVPSSGTGYINSYTEAVAGPKVSETPSDGYTPFIFNPATTGDFYIEFTTTLSIAYHFDLFDITVKDAGNNTVTGRLWSYAWDLNLRSYDNPCNSFFYIYSTDQYLTQIDMNGIQPFGFVMSSNSTGTGNNSNGNNENRKSIPGNSTRPEYKIFLNTPDVNEFPISSTPTMIEDLNIIGSPIMGDSVYFSINMDKPGTVEILLDLNEVTGYQSGSEDVLLVQKLSPGRDTIVWDGKNGFGENVEADVNVSVYSSFATGVTHLPLYDPENHPSGYIVNRISPINESNIKLYWDDSEIGGTVNIDGSLTDGHRFIDYFGDERTMNTWWDGYRIDSLRAFVFTMQSPLPIELVSFKAKYIESKDKVKIEWTTASEFNNDYFVVQKSNDGVEFSSLTLIGGSFNSTTIINYSTIDDNPFLGTSYYRLKQVDFDNKTSYSNIVSVVNKSMNFTLNPNPIYENGVLNITLGDYIPEEVLVQIIKPSGEIIYNYYQTPNNNYIKLNKTLESGVYWINVKCRNQESAKKILVL